MKEVFGITNERWTKAKETAYEARELRYLVQEFNDNFGIEGRNLYILSGPKGYKLTEDLDEIAMAIRHDVYVTGMKWKRVRDRERNLKEFARKEGKLIELYGNNIWQESLPIE